MKLWIASIVLAFVALFTGLVGAYFWFESSRVPIERLGGDVPPRPDGLSPGEQLDRMTKMNTLYLLGMYEAAHKTARLNKTAAIWTAAAVIFGALSSVFGSFASHG
jgi:hypothetical protein